MRATPAVISGPDAAGPTPRQRKLAALVCADVAGFSRLMRADEAATFNGLARLRQAIEASVASHGGRVVSTAGDGLLADFASVVDALSCAVEIQANLRVLNEPLPPERRLELRIGVNLGDVIVAEDGDLYGDGVNIAARLQALAAPGGICLSEPVYEQVKHKLALAYHPLGPQRVKNIAEPVRAYTVTDGASRLPPRGFIIRMAAAAAVVLLVAAGSLAAWQAGLLSPAPSQPSVANLATPARLAERTSVAVMPFKNLSPDPGQDFLADGITEDIINALGRFSNLLIAAKSASFQFKGRNVTPEEAGRALDVRYLVEGSVRHAGDKLRIAVELTDAAKGVHLWSDIYDTTKKDIFTVQDQISERIVGATAVKLTRLERERVLQKPPANLSAYEYLLRGRADLSNPTRQANEEARIAFRHAIELDPNFAPAYVALGWSYYEAAVSGWAEFRDDEINQAETLGNKALALDPVSSGAFQLLANLDVFRREYGRALARIDRALALNPSDAESFRVRGHILLWSGKPAEALSWIEGALRLDPANPVATNNLGIARYLVGDYADAAAVLERSLSRSSSRALQLNAHTIVAAAYAKLGKTEEADRERQQVLRLSPFFDPERFAEQYGTTDARDRILDGLREAGFR